MKRLVFTIAGLWQLSSAAAFAIPQNTRYFCEVYADSPLCARQTTVCTTCHTEAPNLNPYGRDLKAELVQFPDFDRKPASFQKYLRPAALAIEALDSDGDGSINGTEIDAGTAPGDAAQKPGQDALLVFDGELALKRIGLLFCGSSPSPEALQKQRSEVDPILKKQYRQDYLSACLLGDYWKKEALQRLADDKIRPNSAIGAEGDPFVIGDYNYDYRLFAYVLTEGHDARDLLLAQYHINDKWQKVEGTIPSKSVPGKSVLGNGEPLQVDKRYGLLTTQWFIALNTMFADIPRNTASQAYRAYLGLDIAKSEGLFPIDHEPADYDHKGVGQPACAFCHSTLDPLAYAFTPYAGLNVPRYQVGVYVPERTQYEAKGYLMGEPVANLGEWAHKAANSDEFKRNITMMLFKYAVGHAPATSRQRADFEELWQRLDDDGYAADRLLHRLVETLSFAGQTTEAPADIVWKRATTLRNDLAQALALPPEQLCNELGTYSCTDNVHNFALGGHDPFLRAQYVSMEKPSQLTATAFERTVLRSCITRIKKDAANAAQVFRFYALGKTLAETDDAAIQQQIQDLYQRFFRRAASPQEATTALTLADRARFGATRMDEWSQALCLAVGSQWVNLFF